MAAVWNKSKGARGGGCGGRDLPEAFLTTCTPTPAPHCGRNSEGDLLLRLQSTSGGALLKPGFPQHPEHLERALLQQADPGQANRLPGPGETPKPSVALPCRPSQAAPSPRVPLSHQRCCISHQKRWQASWTSTQDTQARAPSIPPASPLTASGN